jgi:class 3 adenylate cyclase
VGMACVAISDVNFSSNFPRLMDPVTIVSPASLSGIYNGTLAVEPLIFLACAASLVVRLIRSRGEQRLQLKWFVYASALAAAAIAIATFALPDPGVAFGAFAPLIPIGAGVAIFKYRLYDIDVVINKTVVYGLLAAFTTAVYVAIVVGIGAAIGAEGNIGLSILATALVAVAFQPVRERSRRFANRLVYGKRATPYEVLSDFSRNIAGTPSTDDTLVRMPRLVVEATGAAQATVWLRLGETLQPEGSWPPTEAPPEPLQLIEDNVEEALHAADPKSRPFLVKHQDELLGILTVRASANEPLTPAGEKLIEDLAAQTGLGLNFERMKERALFARALASFLPPEVAEMVEASPSALSLREEVEATILFSDIRGFSSLAERLAPGEVADVVGRHLAAMTEVVVSHGGTLDKFAGDAVMAVFGAPRKTQDHAGLALRCAIAMQHRQAGLNAEGDRLGLPTSEIGIGLNTGTVIAGTIGGSGRLDYTVLGDAVNVAQRLQSEAAGGEILASAATVTRSSASNVEPAGFKQLKGRQEPVEAYRVLWGTMAGVDRTMEDS